MKSTFTEFVVIHRSHQTSDVSRTSWGEESKIRVGGNSNNGGFCVLDYRAPAHFGPPRHLHYEQDEVLDIVEGEIVLWTPSGSSVLGPGDLVSLPHGVPHTWRAIGETPVRFTVSVVPAGFEDFFVMIAAQNLSISDVAELTEVAEKAGMQIVGPPLSDEEVHIIIAGEHSR